MTEALQAWMVLCIYDDGYEIDAANFHHCIATANLQESLFSLLYGSNCDFMELQRCSVLIFETTRDEIEDLSLELARSQVDFVRKYIKSSKCRTIDFAVKDERYRELFEKIMAAREIIFDSAAALTRKLFADTKLPDEGWSEHDGGGALPSYMSKR